jgi:D-psicose/D-tagatose/L-ribulose 3-epimerase
MKLQNFEKKREEITAEFIKLLKNNPSVKKENIKLSWSNWGFGIEPLEDSAKRLFNNNIKWLELHGNKYGKDLGYNSKNVLKILKPLDIKVSGICGMFGPENDLASNSGISRQNAIDYIRRQLELGYEVGASYMLIVPGAVGRPHAYDNNDFFRSAETLSLVADDFAKADIAAAIEPIRSAEVSIVHTVSRAKEYIKQINHPAIQNINGDIYHMHSEESYIPESIIDAGDMLKNLHLADSNRTALGKGSIDVDAVIMALYIINYYQGSRFATPEPLGSGGDPYPARFGRPDSALLDKLVSDTATYWWEREEQVKTLL